MGTEFRPRRGRLHRDIKVALITAGATVLAAVLAILFSNKANFVTVTTGPAPTVTQIVTKTATTTPTAVAPSSRSRSASAANGTTTPGYYQQPVPVVISGNGPDFDTKPPGPGPGPASFSYNTFSLATGGSSTVGFGFAVWTKGGTPTASDCKSWVSTHLVDHVYTPTAGMKICFGTDQGRIGLLVVQAGTSENQFKAIASVWGS